jgi:tetratricopeptide (TPR) repeat protein
LKSKTDQSRRHQFVRPDNNSVNLFAHLDHICHEATKASKAGWHPMCNVKQHRIKKDEVQGVIAFKYFLFIAAVVLGLGISAEYSLAETLASAAIQFQGDTVHLELSGHQNWDYELKRKELKGTTIVEMSVPKLDESTVESLGKFTSEMVKKIAVDKKSTDGKFLISFTLSGSNIDTFDYLTDQPSRLIVDFYVNPNETLKESLPQKAASLVNKPKKSPSNKERAPSTTDTMIIESKGNNLLPPIQIDNEENRKGIFDGGDPEYERFTVKPYDVKEESIIRSRENYYISFPMFENPVSKWEQLKTTPALYEVTAKNNDENKQMRLLQTLFEKKRYGVFLKTFDWFKEKYPNSEYSELADFMRADVMYALWLQTEQRRYFDDSIQKYKEAVQKYPNSPLAERTSIKNGFLNLERSNGLAALRFFKEHIDNKNFGGKDSLSKDLARLGMGLAYMRLNRWDDSIKQYEDLEKNSTNHDLKVEASYRKGDVWVRAKNYAKAIEEYQRALKKYPEDQNSFANAYYNQAESLFGLQKYQESLSVYRDFIKKFPSNDHAPYALTRMGELMEILGADKSRVMGAYLETYFRYGENQAAIIARLRLLSGRMKGMRPKETDNAVKEIISLAKKSDLPHVEQFAHVMVAEGYTQRGEHDKAIALLSKYYKEHPINVDVPLLSRRIVSNINGKLQHQIDEGNFLDALKTNSEYSDSWLKNSKRLDTKYNIGRAYEMAGVPNEAQKYYQEVLNRIYAIRGTLEAKEIAVKENLPTEDQVNLRLAAATMADQKFNQSYDYLKSIKTPGSMPDVDQIERVDIAIRLLERRGETDSAVRYLGELLKTWKGQADLVAQPYLKLAELLIKQKKSDEAIQALKNILNLAKDSDHVPANIHSKALEILGDLYLSKRSKEQAIASYRELLEKYESSRPLSSIRYKLGEIYFKAGDMQQAADAWHEFKGPKSSFWKNLAQEQMKNSEWRDGYKKYITRIPAMSEKESK